MSRPYRFALIGCGFFAQNHLHAWTEIPEVELVAVCDIDPERAAAAAAQFGGRAYTDAAELFRNEELDFVDIATTAPTHRMMVELAAEHGVAAICQKPLAWDMTDAKAMVSACDGRNLAFMVHENFRFQHPMRRVKEVLDSGAIVQRPEILAHAAAGDLLIPEAVVDDIRDRRDRGLRNDLEGLLEQAIEAGAVVAPAADGGTAELALKCAEENGARNVRVVTTDRLLAQLALQRGTQVFHIVFIHRIRQSHALRR